MLQIERELLLFAHCIVLTFPCCKSVVLKLHVYSHICDVSFLTIQVTHSLSCKQLTKTSGSKRPASEYYYSCVVAYQFAIDIFCKLLPFISSLSMLPYRYTFSTYGHTLSWVGSREQEPKARPFCLPGESYQNP